MSRLHAVVPMLVVLLVLAGCGKQTKLTQGNFAKLYEQMPLEEVKSYLGKNPIELTPGSKGPQGGSSVAAAGGIDLPSGGGSGPELIPPITFSASHKVMEWEDGSRVVQIIFVNDKLRVKAKKGF